MHNDKRKAVRRPIHYTAWIAQKDQPLHGCVLSDISDKGARLAVENVESIPDEFMLFLSRRGSPRRKCRVAWRTDEQIGVKFETSAPKGKPKIKALLAQQASLQPDVDPVEDKKEPA